MGATKLALWAGLERSLHHYCGDVWNRVLQGLHRPIAPHGRAPIRAQPHFQLRLYLFSIWPQEQPPRIHRHPPRPRHHHLGTLCSLSILAHQPHRNRRPQPRMDYLCQHPVSHMGLYCNRVTIEYNLDE